MNIIPDRIDEVERHYEPVKMVSDLAVYLYWASIVISIIILYKDSMPYKSWSDIITYLFPVLVVGKFITQNVINLWLLPAAENNRRESMLSDSFGVPLSQDQTNLYYNNKLRPSLDRMALSTMENTYFTKNTLLIMLKRSIIISGAYFLLWFVLLQSRDTSIDWVWIATQTLFSELILLKTLKIGVYYFRVSTIFRELHTHHLYKINASNNTGIAKIIELFTEYETAKAHASLLLSEKIFKKHNPRLTAEWEKLKSGLSY